MKNVKLLSYIDHMYGLKEESEIIERIMQSPYERLSFEQKESICTSSYYPGTFAVADRINNQDFLFDEKKQSFKEWFSAVLSGELRQLSKIDDFRKKLDRYGKNQLIEDAYDFMFFEDENHKIFAERIANQEYSDFFRRIVLFMLYGNPNHEINTYRDFNGLGLRLIPKVLECGSYTLKERLCQSIYSGLIGMDIKDELAATSPLSEEKIIRLKTDDSDQEKIARIFSRLDTVAKKGIIDVDSWDSFEKQVVNTDEPIKLCWFTDDYIPTMFEMKFMEELLLSNDNISLTIIPRVQSYSNDASYFDVEEFLELPVFTKLKGLYLDGRFHVCHYGLDMGTFNAKRLSYQCAEVVLASDYVIIAGARSYEMGQGINKHCFFTGIAICRNYSETVTGVCKDDGAIVFLEQKAGEKSFDGFKERHKHRKYCKIHDRWYPVAKFTAVDYLKM